MMLSDQLLLDLRSVYNFLLSIFSNVWSLYTTTILSFVVVLWVIAHIIKFFKRFI